MPSHTSSEGDHRLCRQLLLARATSPSSVSLAPVVCGWALLTSIASAELEPPIPVCAFQLGQSGLRPRRSQQDHRALKPPQKNPFLIISQSLWDIRLWFDCFLDHYTAFIQQPIMNVSFQIVCSYRYSRSGVGGRQSACLACTEPPVWSLAWHTLGMAAHTCNLGTQAGGSEVQGHHWAT